MPLAPRARTATDRAARAGGVIEQPDAPARERADGGRAQPGAPRPGSESGWRAIDRAARASAVRRRSLPGWWGALRCRAGRPTGGADAAVRYCNAARDSTRVAAYVARPEVIGPSRRV